MAGAESRDAETPSTISLGVSPVLKQIAAASALMNTSGYINDCGE